MIITVTLNPAVDQTMTVGRLDLGEVNRFADPQLDPAGKGINVSRMAHRLGWPTIAFGLVAGEIGSLIQRALEREAVPHHFIPIPGQTRLSITVVEQAGGRATNLYGPGPAVPPEALTSLEGLLRFWLQGGRVLVLAGSVPPGAPPDIYATYLRLAHGQGVRTILDSDGEPMRLGLEAGPHLIKPNVAEAARLLGRPLPDLAAVVEGARELAARGVAAAVVSMAAEGAVCVRGDRAWRIIPPRVERRSTVGSGDAMVAGLAVALARGDDLEQGLRLGTAAGAATAMAAGTSLGTAQAVAELLPSVEVESLP